MYRKCVNILKVFHLEEKLFVAIPCHLTMSEKFSWCVKNVFAKQQRLPLSEDYKKTTRGSSSVH